MSNLEEKVKNLKSQQEQARELFIKCQGAIEFLQSMIEEETKEEDKKSKK